eukprot:435494-Heterocapsa_arctica.AAC.1
MMPCRRSDVSRCARVADRASVSKMGTSVPRIVLVLHGMLCLHVTVGGCGCTLHSIAVSQPMSST